MLILSARSLIFGKTTHTYYLFVSQALLDANSKAAESHADEAKIQRQQQFMTYQPTLVPTAQHRVASYQAYEPTLPQPTHVMVPQKLVCSGFPVAVSQPYAPAAYSHPVPLQPVPSTHMHPYMDAMHLQARRSGRHYVLNGVKRLHISQDPLMRSQNFFHQYQPEDSASLDSMAKVSCNIVSWLMMYFMIHILHNLTFKFGAQATYFSCLGSCRIRSTQRRAYINHYKVGNGRFVDDGPGDTGVAGAHFAQYMYKMQCLCYLIPRDEVLCNIRPLRVQ